MTAVPAVSAVPFDSSFPKETHREVFRIGAYGAPQCCLALPDAPTATLATAANGRAKTATKPTATKPKDPIRQTKRATKASSPAARQAVAPKAGTRTRDDKDRPLFEDIRFLGRLLGDVVREQEGDTVFDVVETIRQTAVKFRREDDSEAAQTLEKKLRKLTPEQTVSVVRAFSYFSHLANIAEDRHHNRRRRIHALAGSAPQPGTVAYALDQLKTTGNASKRLLQRFFDDALIVPVLTAHPTEVQRKSILDAQHDIARLLAERDQELTARERQYNEAMLRARVTALWQTRMLRDSRLTVGDEIENALSYYRATFLDELPALYGDIEAALAEHGLSARVPAFFQMGSWIGGDRDGNPNVTAATLDEAINRQAAVILEHYLEQVHKLGAELSVSNLLVGANDAVKALAAASPDQSPHRVDEPYRRALIGIYTRLAASARVRVGEGTVPVRSAGRGAPPVRAIPYEDSEAFVADLKVLTASLDEHHGASLAAPRLAPLVRAAEVFGFHLASIDLRQSSDILRRWSPSCSRARASRPTMRRSPRKTSCACCSPRSPIRARCARRTSTTRRSRRASSACSRRRARSARNSVRVRCATTSFRIRKPSATSSRYCCCRRRRACSKARSACRAATRATA